MRKSNVIAAQLHIHNSKIKHLKCIHKINWKSILLILVIHLYLLSVWSIVSCFVNKTFSTVYVIILLGDIFQNK
jgi:hypothetical protein